MGNQRKSGSILQYLMLIVNTLVGILFTPFMVHKLGRAEYGLYQLVASFAGYLMVLDFGIGTTMSRYISKFKAERDGQGEENYLAMSLLQTMAFSVAVLVIGFVIYRYMDGIFSESLTAAEISKAKIIYKLMVFNTAITLADHYFWGILCANEKFNYNVSEKIVRILLRVALISILLIMGFKSIALIGVDLSLTIVMLICDALYCFLKLKIKIKLYRFDGLIFKESFIFAFFIFLQSIINQITMNTDKVILGFMTNTAVVAVYAVSMQVFSIYNSLSTAIQSVFLPKATRLITSGADGRTITDFVTKPSRIQFMVLGLALTGFILIGKEFVLCWMGADYISAYYIALIIMIPGTVELSENVIVSVVLAKNKNGFRTVTMSFVSLFNIVLTIILIKKIGYMGAPVATAVSYLIGDIIILNIYYHRVIKINVFRLFKNILRGTGICLLVTLFAAGAVYKIIPLGGWLGLAVKALIIVSIYAVSMLLFGFNNEEKQMIKEFINKLTGKRRNNNV